jgi:oxalate decarboxylase/phosphoglucose isomerase-like protein (cupin superfamily)
MPFVSAADALNLRAVDLAAIKREAGPAPWRRPLAAGPAGRWVLLEWPPGFAAPAHRHPNAQEVFHVLQGRARFRFRDPSGSAPPEDVDAGPGTFLIGPRNLSHAISVTGDAPLLMLVCVAPNEDRADETVDADPAT